MPPPPLPHDRCTHARARCHAQTHTRDNGRRVHSRGPTQPPGSPAGRRPGRPGPRSSGWRPRGPRCPGTSCWAVVLGMLAPQRGPGEAAASGSEPIITPWGSRCYNTHLRGHWNVSGIQPQMAPRRRGATESLDPGSSWLAPAKLIVWLAPPGF